MARFGSRISVSVSLLVIGSRFGVEGSSTASLRIELPGVPVTVTSKVKVVGPPGGMFCEAQVTVPEPKVQAGEQVPVPLKLAPAGIASVTLATKAAPGLFTWTV